MRRLYYSGGLGELITTGPQASKLAELEEVSISVECPARAVRGDWEAGAGSAVQGPGSAVVNCTGRITPEAWPELLGPSSRAFVRRLRVRVPDGEPYSITLAHKALSESLVVETETGELMDMLSVPGPGAFSYDPREGVLRFHPQDASRQLLVSYAHETGSGTEPQPRSLGLILVFPLLGRGVSGGYRVIEARRAVLSSFQELFHRADERVVKLSFVVLADSEGQLIRQSTWEAE